MWSNKVLDTIHLQVRTVSEEKAEVTPKLYDNLAFPLAADVLSEAMIFRAQ